MLTEPHSVGPVRSRTDQAAPDRQPSRSPTDRPLTGRAALVTGAGGSIGRSIAVALSELGATTGLVGRSRDSLDTTAVEAPGFCPLLPADLTDEEDVDELARTVNDDLFADGLDILVHSAGVYGKCSTATASPETFDLMYETNVRAPYRLTQHLLPALTRRGGQIVFVGSTQALKADENVGQYAATQSARKAIADSLRDEVKDDGVRILTVYIGSTASALQERIAADEGRVYRPELLLQPADIARSVACCLTLAPTARVTDLTIRPALRHTPTDR